MSPTSRVDGIHFGTGEDMSSGFFELADPASPTVINEPEAQWHYAAIQDRRPNACNVWRSSPAVRPAQVGWSAHTFSREVFRGIDQHHDRTGTYPTDILLLNELNLDYERGDAKNDGGAYDTNPANWPTLYTLVAGFLDGLLESCKERAFDRGFTPRWWFPAWAPGHGEYRPEIAKIWTPVARKYDCVALHSYTDADTITSDVLWYLQQFPEQEIGLFEWNTINLGEPHSPERYTEEVRIRSRLQALGRSYSRLSATYFIYAWAEDRSHEHDIKGDEERTAIWDGQIAIPYDSWEPNLFHPPADSPTEPVPPADPVPPEEATMPDFPFGIDVSNNNGHIDWPRAAHQGGVEFAIAKITEGVHFRDGYFVENWQAMKAQGIQRGAYHFARPSINAAVDEATYFVNAFGLLSSPLETGDIVALDLEDEAASGDLSGWTLSWCQTVEALLGYKPMVYCSPGYIQGHRLQNRPELAEYGLWLASWGVPTPPPAPPPWSLVALHQYGVGPAGTVQGVQGEIDLNHFNGTLPQMALYGKPETIPEQPPQPTPPHAESFAVGEGILTEMHGRGSEPASDEMYGPFWSEAMDIDGRIYRYQPKTGLVHVYDPS